MYTAIVKRNNEGEYFFKIWDNEGIYITGDNSFSWQYVYSMLADYDLQKVLTDKYPMKFE